MSINTVNPLQVKPPQMIQKDREALAQWNELTRQVHDLRKALADYVASNDAALTALTERVEALE